MCNNELQVHKIRLSSTENIIQETIDYNQSYTNVSNIMMENMMIKMVKN